jgi:polysaccharide biosynthesis protein PslH
MNILFLCHRVPFPPNRGGKIRPFQMVQHLSRNHAVTVASLAHTQEELDAAAGLRDYCDEVIAEVLPDQQRWTNAVLALPTSMPSSLRYFWSPRLAQRIRRRTSSKLFDVVMVHCAFASQYAIDVPAPLKVLDYGDLDSGKWSEYSRDRRFPLSFGYGIESWKLRRYEISVANYFSRCTVTTDGELEEYRRIGISKPCSVIPNGVDFNYFQPRPPASAASRKIVFLGRMDYFPNIQGIERFVREVLPIVRRTVPEAELYIVGANPAAAVQKLAMVPGVTVTGSVPDVRPYLDNVALSIAPLYLARGTQNKILECMAMKVPVVSTIQAAKGVRAEAGRDFLVSSSTQEMASHVIALLRDPDLRARLADSALETIKQEHCWPSSMKLLDRVLFAAPVAVDAAMAD